MAQTHVLRFLCPRPGCAEVHAWEGDLETALKGQRRVLTDGAVMAVIYTEAAWLSCELDAAEERIANPQNLADVFAMTAAARATHEALNKLAKPGKSG